MADMIKPDYPCSQKDLYSIMETGWANYTTQLAKFGALKLLYTAAYKTTALTAVAAAKAMPDDQTRSANAETLRIDLVLMGGICTQNFQLLKSYIETAFANKDAWKPQFEAAGQDYYRDATNEDWESVVSLNTNAKNYLGSASNLALLTAGNNMPPAFVATQKTASDNFDAQYLQFKQAEQTSVETANKIKANNTCYKTFMGMMRDGHTIFAKDADVIVKFEFQSLWDLINPPIGGIKGGVKEAVTFAVIDGAKVTTQKTGEAAKEVFSDADGKFTKALSAGDYTITAEAAGYITQTMHEHISKDGYRTFDFVMVKV